MLPINKINNILPIIKIAQIMNVTGTKIPQQIPVT